MWKAGSCPAWRGVIGKGYILLLLGFHIHTHFLSHMYEAEFWPLGTCGKWVYVRFDTLVLSVSVQSGRACTLYTAKWCISWNDLHILLSVWNWHALMCVYRLLPCVNEQTPLCLNRRRVCARERPKTKEKIHWMCKCHIWRAQCGLVVLRTVFFPMHCSHKNTSICILLCGLECITSFVFFL